MKTVIKYFLLLMLSFVLGFCFTLAIWLMIANVENVNTANNMYLALYFFSILFTQLVIYLLGRKKLFHKKKCQIIINIAFFALSIFCYLVSSFYAFVLMFNYGMSGL